MAHIIVPSARKGDIDMLQWGVLGLGRIAHRFVESLSHFEEAQFYAGASHSEEKRKDFMKYNPCKLYDSYDELLQDPEVDVVYIALPHGSHYHWSMKALEHNKCVLCEKPAMLSSKEMEEVAKYAKDHHLFFMEAMKTRFMPLTHILHKEIEKGIIGDIVHISNHFNSKVDYHPDHYLFDQSQGGALYDTGTYCVASILDYIHSPISSISSKVRKEHGVDVHDEVEITFENGTTASFSCSIDAPERRDMIIKGTKGTITMSPFYRPMEAVIDTDDGESMTCIAKTPDDFYPEIKAVHQAIAYIEIESPYMTHQDSIDVIKVIESIRDTFDD